MLRRLGRRRNPTRGTHDERRGQARGRRGGAERAEVARDDGAEVRVVYDGRSALAMADAFLPTSVLLDIGMPGMDGYEVARRLRQDERFTGVRIAALTGWGQDADRRQTRNRGFSYHLTKPVSIEELHRILT